MSDATPDKPKAPRRSPRIPRNLRIGSGGGDHSAPTLIVQPGRVELLKNDQRFIFSYTPGDEAQLLSDLADMARNPGAALTWFDVALVSDQLGKQMKERVKKTG